MDLAVHIEGKGPTLVLNHGWTMSQQVFEKQRALANKFRLVFWDLPGHGESEKRSQGYSISDCSQALQQIVDEYDIKEAIALGWSMGAQVIWDYVQRFGEGPFRAFVNVDSVPWGDPDRYQVPAVRFAFSQNRARAQRKFIQKMFAQKQAEASIEFLLGESLKTPDMIALKLYSEIADCDYREIFRQLRGPVFSMMGRHNFQPEPVIEMTHLRPNDPVTWFEHSGHAPFWEEAKHFNVVLEKTLEAYAT